MGLFDKKDKSASKSVLDEADAGISDDFVTKMIQQLIEFGIEGKGPLKSAKQTADAALNKTGSIEKAIDKIVSDHLKVAAAGGFVTGLGGFVTMPVALPVNVIEFYVTATRMVAATASLRGYDVNDDRVRTAVLIALTGTRGDDLLAKVGITPVAGATANMLLGRLPKAALMMVQKGIGFRLIRQLGTKIFAKAGKFVPIAGGVIGAGLDGYMLNKIAKHARKEFPAQSGKWR